MVFPAAELLARKNMQSLLVDPDFRCLGPKKSDAWKHGENTPLKVNSDFTPENGCLEYYIVSFLGRGMAYFQGRTGC